MSDVNLWQQVLDHAQRSLEPEDFRRWFSGTSYAADSGDQVSVWVPTESVRRHLELHFQDVISQALNASGRPDTHVRFVVAGFSDEEAEEWEES
jgi:chromosomal replication initiation ATPase DnaA